jgi:hypothetical protein
VEAHAIAQEPSIGHEAPFEGHRRQLLGRRRVQHHPVLARHHGVCHVPDCIHLPGLERLQPRAKLLDRPCVPFDQLDAELLCRLTDRFCAFLSGPVVRVIEHRHATEPRQHLLQDLEALGVHLGRQ